MKFLFIESNKNNSQMDMCLSSESKRPRVRFIHLKLFQDKLRTTLQPRKNQSRPSVKNVALILLPENQTHDPVTLVQCSGS